MTRRLWKERLVPNCDAISVDLIARWKLETGLDAWAFPKEFLDWVGLKPTKVALMRVNCPLKK